MNNPVVLTELTFLDVESRTELRWPPPSEAVFRAGAVEQCVRGMMQPLQQARNTGADNRWFDYLKGNATALRACAVEWHNQHVLVEVVLNVLETHHIIQEYRNKGLGTDSRGSQRGGDDPEILHRSDWRCSSWSWSCHGLRLAWCRPAASWAQTSSVLWVLGFVMPQFSCVMLLLIFSTWLLLLLGYYRFGLKLY